MIGVFEWIQVEARMRFSTLVLLLSLGIGLAVPAYAKESAMNNEGAVSDVRVLIDISGSMKKNDPNNLRVPALRLITQLLPEGTNGGVWTFGQFVNMLVTSGQIDKKWKSNAYKAAAEINSAGMYTNIEGVLEKSTWDWIKPDPKANRSIIFLTDGLLDISKDANENKKAKNRVLKKTLNRLKDAGATIHTIALSGDADKTFLRQLSAATKGWYEEVKTADQLERIFFKMFEKSVPVESIPLTDNKVLVDSSIRELTLLIFRKAGAQNVEVVLPNGEKIHYNMTKMEGVRWRHEERYDLITVESPLPGEWSINADLDPDNRVMVVADLKVRANKLPNLMMGEDLYPYYVELVEKAGIIKKVEFLDLVKVSLERNAKEQEKKEIKLNDDGKQDDRKAHDGRFTAVIGEGIPQGKYTYTMLVDGITFKRSKRYTVHVVDHPVAVTVKEVKPGDPAKYSLTLTPYSELIKPETILIDAVLKKEGSGGSAITIPRTGPNEWRLDMDINQGEFYDVKISVQADRVSGKAISSDLGSYRLGDGDIEPYRDDEPEEVVEEKVKEEAKEESKPESENVEEVAEEDTSDEEVDTEVEGEEAEGEAAGEEDPNWIMTIVKVVGFNVVLILIGFFVYRKFIAKPKPKKNDDEEGEEEEEAKPDD